MKNSIKKPLSLLLCLILAISGCMMIAHGVQTGHGSIKVSNGSFETELGTLTYKLYVPDNATAETPAPAVFAAL